MKNSHSVDLCSSDLFVSICLAGAGSSLSSLDFLVILAQFIYLAVKVHATNSQANLNLKPSFGCVGFECDGFDLIWPDESKVKSTLYKSSVYFGLDQGLGILHLLLLYFM